MKPTNKISDLIVITGRLADILERENAALASRDHQGMNRLLDEKVTIGRIYESRLLAIEENPSLLDDVDEELKERLKSLGEKINSMIEKNGMLLKAAIEANRRVVDLIAEAVRDATPNAGTYSSKGSTEIPNQSHKPQNVSITLDQTL